MRDNFSSGSLGKIKQFDNTLFGLLQEKENYKNIYYKHANCHSFSGKKFDSIYEK